MLVMPCYFGADNLVKSTNDKTQIGALVIRGKLYRSFNHISCRLCLYNRYSK